MIVNGENVKVCMQNLARWVPELRDHMSTILGAASLTEMDSVVQRSADLADQMLNGIDLDENGEIDPVADECGALVAYDYAYHMADMPLLPVTVNSLATTVALSETVTPTQTATPSSLIFPSPTRRPNEDQSPDTQAPATVAPANDPPPEEPPGPGNNPPKPTKKPKDPPPGSDGGDPGAEQDPKPTKDKP
jgi:hypothetical protein